MIAVRPDLQIVLRRTPKGFPVRLLLGIIKEHIQLFQQFLRLYTAPLPGNEGAIEERHNKRSLICGQKPPGCVIHAQAAQILISHILRYFRQNVPPEILYALPEQIHQLLADQDRRHDDEQWPYIAGSL